MKHATPIHNKVAGSLKSLKQVDEVVKLSSLEEGFEQAMKDLDTAMTFANKTVAVHLGVTYLYQKMPQAKKMAPKRDFLKDLRQVWKDAKKMVCIRRR